MTTLREDRFGVGEKYEESWFVFMSLTTKRAFTDDPFCRSTHLVRTTFAPFGISTTDLTLYLSMEANSFCFPSHTAPSSVNRSDDFNADGSLFVKSSTASVSSCTDLINKRVTSMLGDDDDVLVDGNCAVVNEDDDDGKDCNVVDDDDDEGNDDDGCVIDGDCNDDDRDVDDDDTTGLSTLGVKARRRTSRVNSSAGLLVFNLT